MEKIKYKHIRKFWTHKTVNHSLEYVTKDGIHTNSVEGFWALLKRGIKGNFHWLSKKYLESYVTEFEFRYNNREPTACNKTNLCLAMLFERLLCL